MKNRSPGASIGENTVDGTSLKKTIKHYTVQLDFGIQPINNYYKIRP